MTISSATNKVIYTANGILVGFDFTFKTQNESDIQVYLDDVLQGTGFTTVLNGDQDTSPGGTVTFDVAPADQVIVTIAREVPLSQEVDYQPYDPFPANTHEAALDKLTMQNQQQQEELDRTTKASISDDGSTDYTLPLYDAGKAIVWDDPTKQLVNSDDKINSITATAQQSADDAAASAALSSGSAGDSAASAGDSAASAVDSAGFATDSDNTLKDFETKYLGAKTSDPTLDNEGNALIDGALYYNTTNNVMRVYDLGTTSWADVGSSTAEIYQYSSTSAGQTVITGADDNANVLIYVAGFIQVFYNGQLLSDTDYVETSSTVITLADGVEVAGDQITILAFGTFDVANTYTQAQSDANFQPKGRSPWTVGGTLDTTSGAAVGFTGIPSWATEVKLLVENVSLSGTGKQRFQVGNSGGYLTSGYTGNNSAGTSANLWTGTGIAADEYASAATQRKGVILLTKTSDTVWMIEGLMMADSATTGYLFTGRIDVLTALDRVQVVASAGTLDNGRVTVLWR